LQNVARNAVELPAPGDDSGVEQQRPKFAPILCAPGLIGSRLFYLGRGQWMAQQYLLGDVSGQDAEEILQFQPKFSASQKVKVISANRKSIDFHAKAALGPGHDGTYDIFMPEQRTRTSGDIRAQSKMKSLTGGHRTTTSAFMNR
jgi:hypothetical protein